LTNGAGPHPGGQAADGDRRLAVVAGAVDVAECLGKGAVIDRGDGGRWTIAPKTSVP